MSLLLWFVEKTKNPSIYLLSKLKNMSHLTFWLFSKEVQYSFSLPSVASLFTLVITASTHRLSSSHIQKRMCIYVSFLIRRQRCLPIKDWSVCAWKGTLAVAVLSSSLKMRMNEWMDDKIHTLSWMANTRLLLFTTLFSMYFKNIFWTNTSGRKCKLTRKKKTTNFCTV